MLLERAEDLERELREVREHCCELEENNELLREELVLFQESRGDRPLERTLTDLEGADPDDLKEEAKLDRKERTLTEWDLQEVEAKWDVRLQEAIEHSQELEEECQRLRNVCQELREEGRPRKRQTTIRPTLHADRPLLNQEAGVLDSELAEAHQQIVELQVEIDELREKNGELQNRIEEAEIRHQGAVDIRQNLEVELANMQARCQELEDSCQELQNMFDEARDECFAHNAHVKELSDMLDEEKQRRASLIMSTQEFTGAHPPRMNTPVPLPDPPPEPPPIAARSSAAPRGGLATEIEDFDMQVPEVGRPVSVVIKPVDQGAALRNFLDNARSESVALQRKLGEEASPVRQTWCR